MSLSRFSWGVRMGRTETRYFNWDFSANGQAFTAIAQSFTRSQKDGSVRGSTTDMAFPVAGEAPLALSLMPSLAMGMVF